MSRETDSPVLRIPRREATPVQTLRTGKTTLRHHSIPRAIFHWFRSIDKQSDHE